MAIAHQCSASCGLRVCGLIPRDVRFLTTVFVAIPPNPNVHMIQSKVCLLHPILTLPNGYGSWKTKYVRSCSTAIYPSRGYLISPCIQHNSNLS